MPDIVTYFFRGLSLQVSIGFLAKELAAPQAVMIDLEYDCPDTPNPTDEIGTVLNYDSVRQEVAAIVKNRHFNLQETLCREVLQSLLARPEVVRAKVSINKPDIYPDVDAVGVSMEAKKPERNRSTT
jgi:7,8-dihydroneopterin aldolase/epimerase/oxygenase